MSEKLTMTAAEAAKALGVCMRTLWTYTARGEIPAMRIGRKVLYPRAVIEQWLCRTAEESANKRRKSED